VPCIVKMVTAGESGKREKPAGTLGNGERMQDRKTLWAKRGHDVSSEKHTNRTLRRWSMGKIQERHHEGGAGKDEHSEI